MLGRITRLGSTYLPRRSRFIAMPREHFSPLKDPKREVERRS